MATITTDTYLDSGTPRTAREAWTCNGGILTVRTDTRWHIGAPANMTGSIGAVTISSTLGGGYYIDGTAVRWMPFNNGSGNVPAIGTTITQGGVSGYLLGVWASLTSAPSAVGSAMPTSGFIKFREVTGGTFSAGALTGIGANATSADVTGWIEVVHSQSTTITVPRLGKFQTRGDWFYLDNTNGSANQLIQVPTNGSATTYVPGVWIETGVGTNVYEYYPSLYAAGMTTTNLGTDARSKFVCMETNGQIRIGHNGTTNVGYVPVSGCRVRIPNILGRQCATTSGQEATNVIPAATTTRPNFTTTAAGAIDIENFATDWYLYWSQAYSVRLKNVATFTYTKLSEIATALDIDNVGISNHTTIDDRSFNATSCFAGGTIKNCKFQRYSTGTSDHSFEIIYCKDITVTNVTSGIIQYARSSGMSFQVTQSTGIKLNNCYSINSGVQFTSSFDCELNNLDHTDRYVGTTTTTGIYAVYILASCNNVLVNGLTFGFGGTIANVHPYLGLYNVGQSSNIKLRNVGSRTSPLNGGSLNNPAYIFVSAGNNNTVKLQRLYMTPTRTGAISTTNSDKNMIYEHVYGDMGDTIVLASLNSVAKNCGGTTTTTGQSAVYGTHFWDAFTSDTDGRVTLAMNEPTVETASYVTYVAGTPKFTSSGQLVMASLNDEIIIEQSYFVKGCTGLSNTSPVVTGTNVTYSSGATWGNHYIYYQIDTGNGWNGSWKDLNATNLSEETISPSTGFKLKYRIVTKTAATNNAITYIRINTTSTLEAQTDNLYDLDTNTLELTGLVPGSEVRCYAGTDPATAVEIGGVESSGTNFILTHSSGGVAGYIRIHSLGYQAWSLNYTYTASDVSIPVQQILDRQYDNPV